MKRYDYAEGCMEEKVDGEYVLYSEAEDWRKRAGRLTNNLIQMGQENRDLKDYIENIKGDVQ